MIDRRDRTFLVALSLIAVAYVILFAHYFGATMIRRPYWDMFNYVADYLDYPQRGGFAAYLWSQYQSSEHRQIWMRLLTAIDVGIFRGVAYPFLAVATACLFGVLLLVAREIARTQLPGNLAATAIWFVLLLTLSTAYVVDCSIPIEGIYPQTAFFVVLSLVLFDGNGEDGQSATSRRIAAIAAAIGAGFASALGLIVWPILVWAAWRGGLGWRWIAGMALSGALFILVYVHGLALHGSTASALRADDEFYATANLLQVVDAFFTFLGLPWTREAALCIAGRVVGAGLLLAGAIAIVWRGFLSRRCERLERISLGLIMFSLATAALAAVGRVGSEAGGILPVRYAVLMVPLHIGIFCLTLFWLRERWVKPGSRRAMEAMALTFGLAMLVQQIAAGEAGAAKAQAMNAMIGRFIEGEQDPTMTRFVYRDLDFARQVVNEMRRRGIFQGLD